MSRALGSSGLSIDSESVLASLASVADPEIRGAAERLARKLQDALGDDSWVLSEPAERVFGLLKGLVEVRTKSWGPVASTALEKLIDLLDFASVDFFRGDKSSQSRITSEWLAQFQQAASVRLLAADDVADLESERDRLHREFEIRKEIAELVENEIGPPETAAPREKRDWDETLRGWTESIEVLRTRLRGEDDGGG